MPISPNDVIVHRNELQRQRIHKLSDLIDDLIRENAYNAVCDDNSISLRFMFKVSNYANESFTDDEILAVEQMFLEEWEAVKFTKVNDSGAMSIYLHNTFKRRGG